MSDKGIPNAEIERLITGQPTDDPVLARLAPVVVWLRRQGETIPEPEQISRFAAEASQLAVNEPPRSISLRHRRAWWRPVPRFAVPLAVVLVMMTFTGAAVAAQSTVPGELLYGLNVALERVGIGDGGMDERLDEAARLVDRGRAEEALAHVVRAMAAEDAGDSAAVDALNGLAQAVESVGSDDPSSEQSVRGMVAEMLQWMLDNSGLLHDPDAEPGSFGRGVAEMARRIAAERGMSPEDHGPPVDPGDQGSQGDGAPPGNQGQGPPQGPNRP